MNIEEIEDWIYDLENDVTSENNIVDLASLYIIRDHLGSGLNPMVDDISNEINDVLPIYNKYKDKKKRQQLNEIPEDGCVVELKRLCQEIKELIIALYAGTTLGKERRIIFNMIEELYNKYKK